MSAKPRSSIWLPRTEDSAPSPVGGNTQQPVFALPTGGRKSELYRNFLLSLEKRSAAFSPDAIHSHRALPLDATVFIDSPDIDSINQQNHFLAERLLLLADVILYVVTKEKYADRKPLMSMADVLDMKKDIIVIFNKSDATELNQLFNDFSQKSGIKPVFKMNVPFDHDLNSDASRKNSVQPRGALLADLSAFLERLNQRHAEAKRESMHLNLKFIISKLRRKRKISFVRAAEDRGYPPRHTAHSVRGD